MEECLGRPPEMKELGEKFPYYSKAMLGSLEEAWDAFIRAVNDAREFWLRDNATSKPSSNRADD